MKPVVALAIAAIRSSGVVGAMMNTVSTPCAWQAFVTYVDPETAPMPRNALMEHLQAAGISTRPGTHAVHMLGVYRDRFGFSPDDFPSARDCDRNSMAIPLHNRMSADDYEHVIATLCAI